MATGFAKGAAVRGKRIAFGDGRRIIWGPSSELIFRGNPNVAKPGCERDSDIEWVDYYKGHRRYNRLAGDRWIWNMDYRPKPGEMFLSDAEKKFADGFAEGFVLIEPHVPPKSVAPNKDWGFRKFQTVAEQLTANGYQVAQFNYGKPLLAGVKPIGSRTFREAAAVLSRAQFAILPEGGLHHAAAAMGVPAVVVFGGFIPPQVTGYDFHVNLTGGASQACGSLRPCKHCRQALDAISVDDVMSATERLAC